MAKKQQYALVILNHKRLFIALSLFIAVIIVFVFFTAQENVGAEEGGAEEALFSPLADEKRDYTMTRNYATVPGTEAHMRAVWQDTILFTYLLDDGNTVGLATVQTDGQNFTPIWESTTVNEFSNEFFHTQHQGITYAAMRSDGTVLIIRNDYGVKMTFSDNEKTEETSLAGVTLMHMRLDGTIISETNLVELLNLDTDYMFLMQNIQTLSDDSLLIGYPNMLHILSPELTLCRQFKWGTEVITFEVAKNDRVFVYFLDEDAWTTRVLEYDITTGSFKEDVLRLLGLSMHNIFPGSYYDLYFISEHAVYGLELATQKLVQLINRQDEGIPEQFSVGVNNLGQIILFETNWNAWAVPTTPAVVKITSGQ
jgi:hypothetical protein